MRKEITMPTRRIFMRLLGAFALVVAVPSFAQAASLDEFRAQGVIAERYDGFVELREPNASAEARRIVEQVNAERRQVYQRRAEQQGVPQSEVAKVYAEQILQNAPAGTYFKQPNGSYVRK